MKILKDYNPKNVKKAYKVFRVKDGKLYPPMVANANNEPTPIGVWLGAEEGAFAGLSKTGRPQVKSIGSGTLSYRPGWHLGDIPRAKQFDRLNKETGEVEFPKDFVWAECEYVADKDYQKDSDEQGHIRIGKDGKPYRSDKYQHSLAGLQKIPADGYYKYRTNPNPDTVPWVITGAIKVDKLLGDDEVNDILNQNGIEPIHRQGGDKTLKELGINESLNEELSQQQEEFFKNSKVRDKNGNLLICYHGTPYPGFKKFGEVRQDDYKYKGYEVNFFTSDREVAGEYTEFGHEDESKGNVYVCYLNIENPYIVDNETKEDLKNYSERKWSNIRDKYISDRRVELYNNFTKWFGQWLDDEDVEKVNKDLKPFGMYLKKAVDEKFPNNMFYNEDETLYNVHKDSKVISSLSFYTLDELFDEDEDIMAEWREAMIGRSEQDENGWWVGYTTNDVIRMVIYMNENEGTDYDGVFFYDIKDSATGSTISKNSDLYVTIKSPNQIKLISNLNPTDSDNIDEMLNESKDDIEKFRQWAGDDLANKFFKLKNRLQGEEKDIYYWMGRNKQDLAFSLKEVEETPTKKERSTLAKEGSEKIYEDDKWLVLRIDNYEASRRYGKSTKWCISGDRDDRGSRFFDIYTGGLNDIYFYIQKNTPYKYALQFNDIHNWTLWNEEDFLDVGEGPLFEEAVEIDVEWHPDIIRQEAPQFPIVKGLPDITKRWNYILTHKEEFPGYVDESLKEEKETYGELVFDDDTNKYKPFTVYKGWFPYDYDPDSDTEDFVVNKVYNIYKDNEYVGGIALNVEDDSCCKIQGIYVKPKVRHLGIGKTAVDFLKSKYDKLEIESTPKAIKFWQKQGFDVRDFDGNDDIGYYGGWKKQLKENKDSKTITTYHGSQQSDLQLSDEPIYLSNSKRLAKQFALGYCFGFNLNENDYPTMYTIEVTMNNPLYIKTEDEYEELMDITNIDETKEYLKSNGYDGIIYQDEEYEPDLIYYMPLNAKEQCKILNKEDVDPDLRFGHKYYYDDSEVEAQELSTYEAFMNLKGEDDE